MRHTAGVDAGEGTSALRKLEQGGLIERHDGGYRPNVAELRDAARSADTSEMPTDFGTGDAGTEMVLRTFVRNGRLIDFPAQWAKKVVVLSHVAAQTFRPGATYPEGEVNELLHAWCIDAPVDHVSLRRYVIDAGIVEREAGQYRRIVESPWSR